MSNTQTVAPSSRKRSTMAFPMPDAPPVTMATLFSSLSILCNPFHLYSDFFRRWHITLTRWFTDYVYIPLGGNRRGLLRRMFNTVVVFALCGLWHGANWTYVLWAFMRASL
nr:hypothetical protein [Clostridia bacterium]